MSRIRWDFVCFLTLSAPACFAARTPITIDSVIAGAPGNAGQATSKIIWSPDGSRFILKERGALYVCDVESGREREVIPLNRLDEAAVKGPPPVTFDWTNRRVGESDVQWFANGRRLLVAAGGDLFLVDIEKGTFDALTRTAEAERDPKLSPDNKYVSFRRGPNLYVMEVATKQFTRLTSDGADTLLNGQPDWVYPEELNLGTAHWWSPDSQHIAYLQFDVSHEPVFPQVSMLSFKELAEPQRYPKAGDPNADVRLGVVSFKGGETRWMGTGERRGMLLARVAWTPDSASLLYEQLNRIQNHMDLKMASAQTGTSRAVLTEDSPSWINVQEFIFTGSGQQFLRTSEVSGFRHIYSDKQLTRGDWEVQKIEGVDPANGRIYFTSNEDGPLEHQLYSIDSDGSNKTRLSSRSGSHTISLAPGAAYFMDDFSSLKDEPRSTLYRTDGSLVRVFRQVKIEPEGPELLPSEIVEVKGVEGTPLYARLIKPVGFHPGVKYPAIVMVYGGPGVQSIRNVWEGVTWDQYMAQQGFVIWQLDNRGSAGRGRDFESVIYHDLGRHELEDQKLGIEYLIAQGFVDPKRIGMYGWSYGGFMTLNTVMNAPGLIKAAIAGAPVTNWRNYDSIYTDRYMGLPEDNEGAYDATSPQFKAANMNGTKLLILHNMEDDNVHFQNSLQMANALENADKRFYMVVYAEKSHGVTGPAHRQLLEETTAFFEENLK